MTAEHFLFCHLNPIQLTLTAPVRGMPTTHFVQIGRPRPDPGSHYQMTTEASFLGSLF